MWGSCGRGAGPFSFFANQFAGIDRARISIDVTQGIYRATLDAHALEYYDNSRSRRTHPVSCMYTIYTANNLVNNFFILFCWDFEEWSRVDEFTGAAVKILEHSIYERYASIYDVK